jgi:hypothetical protein
MLLQSEENISNLQYIQLVSQGQMGQVLVSGCEKHGE